MGENLPICSSCNSALNDEEVFYYGNTCNACEELMLEFILNEKQMFNAEMAKELTKKGSPQYHVDLILEEVKKAASLGYESVKTTQAGFGEGHLYAGEPTELQKRILKEMNCLGFKTQICCEELQFVNIYLEISWK